MKWMDALKMWNSQREKWTIPKKGTDGYKECRALMDGEKPDLKPSKKASKKASKKKSSKKSETKDFDDMLEVAVEFDSLGKAEKPKRKRGRPKKE